MRCLQSAKCAYLYAAILAVVSLGAAFDGCSLPFAPPPSVAFDTVEVAGARLLEKPLVPRADLYKPAYRLDLATEQSASLEITAFIVTVITDQPQNLRLRLDDTIAGTTTDLARLSAPASAADDQAILQTLADTVRTSLSAGQPVFAVLPQSAADPLYQDLAVLLPGNLLSANTRLWAYITLSAEGQPLGGDSLELVGDFFYMAAIGDSVMWGNGLRPEDKFVSLVADTIERDTGRKVITQMWAISGAEIVPAADEAICGIGCFGEAPRTVTSITTQATLIDQPQALDLILVDGCINDVRLETILSPETEPEELSALVDLYCAQAMTDLLEQLRADAPQAYIVVTGYYPIISEDSDLLGFSDYATLNDITAEDTEQLREFVELAARNAAVFDNQSAIALAQVVADRQSEANDQHIAFVDPGFTVENAIFTPDSWLWSLTSENSQVQEQIGDFLSLFPEDPLLDVRLEACLGDQVTADAIVCVYASVGHPNPAGARAYAQGIVEALRNFGIIP